MRKAWGPLIPLLVAYLCFEPAAFAHNGNIAFSQAIHFPITLDGDLREWEGRFHSNPITRIAMGKRRLEKDSLQAEFFVCHNPDLMEIYVAVRVLDDSLVFESEQPKPDWNDLDGCDIYLDFQHLGSESKTVQLSIWGTKKQPNTRGGLPSILNDFPVEVSRNSKGYEYKIPLNPKGAKSNMRFESLNAGTIIGFDVAIMDKDADGTFSFISWGRGTKKVDNPWGLGDLVFLEKPHSFSQLEGRLLPSIENQQPSVVDKLTGIFGAFPQTSSYRRIRVRAIKPLEFNSYALTDYDGFFSLRLPVGDYEVIPNLLKNQPNPSISIQLRANTSTAVNLKEPRVQPYLSSLTNPIVQNVTGIGYQYQVRKYDITDGLLSTEITCLLQDLEKNLWIGTSNGINRYNGQEMLPYLVPKGAQATPVISLVEIPGARQIIAATSSNLFQFVDNSFQPMPVKGWHGQI